MAARLCVHCFCCTGNAAEKKKKKKKNRKKKKLEPGSAWFLSGPCGPAGASLEAFRVPNGVLTLDHDDNLCVGERLAPVKIWLIRFSVEQGPRCSVGACLLAGRLSGAALCVFFSETGAQKNIQHIHILINMS